MQIFICSSLFFVFYFLFIYFTKTTLFTPLTLQSIYSTLLNIIYSTLLKSLKYLHCFYLLIYLFIYLGRACTSPERSDVFCELQLFPSSNSTRDSYVTTFLTQSGSFYHRQGKEVCPTRQTQKRPERLKQGREQRRQKTEYGGLQDVLRQQQRG